METTLDSLKIIIGDQQIEITLLRSQIAKLEQQAALQAERIKELKKTEESEK